MEQIIDTTVHDVATLVRANIKLHVGDIEVKYIGFNIIRNFMHEAVTETISPLYNSLYGAVDAHAFWKIEKVAKVISDANV
jgi:hypothetical protein